MKTQEILSITALSALGLCLLCGLAKMAMKSNEAKKSCDQACGILVFAAVVLVAVSQLLEEIDEKLELGKKDCNKFWLQGDDKAITNFMSTYNRGSLPSPLPPGSISPVGENQISYPSSLRASRKRRARPVRE